MLHSHIKNSKLTEMYIKSEKIVFDPVFVCVAGICFPHSHIALSATSWTKCVTEYSFFYERDIKSRSDEKRSVVKCEHELWINSISRRSIVAFVAQVYDLSKSCD